MPIVVLVTVPPDAARNLARTLVEERLAASVNVLPGLQSVYRWEGEVAEESETLLLVKTTRARYDALETRLLELHPYDVPEIVALPIEKGLPEYMTWLTDGTRF
ncbi:divalent-cation tolerance protein CutA [Deinococcus yavapaiensis]|uniref:Uncharacterized protein involved in tolerance to divalent cations n=1 Tax=Deinococcus yavapaiensis KR-236 TaxID=694435 RepID=A0A318SER2_9DEIO|nr:divalent-cation tolerance protein CutA [Deinococcus yavapaiensis]PYE51829.1 uncharacterized protein involved in tolerance to divalent cations [Deinococcus yavapaiensis KR-236]